MGPHLTVPGRPPTNTLPPCPTSPTQMANMLNARKVGNKYNVLNGLFTSHIFWVVWVLVAGFQVRVQGGSAVRCGAGQYPGGGWASHLVFFGCAGLCMPPPVLCTWSCNLV